MKMFETHIPPIKSQGIKTKLLPFINRLVPFKMTGRWIEPFMGTGCVGFNLAKTDAIMCDANPCVVAFYQGIAEGTITARIVRSYLQQEGTNLARDGEAHYYAVRDRFNREGDPLDFLFLNRACFNGMIRFNRKGEFNTPFCRKPERFAPALITKIVNQVVWLEKLFARQHFEFRRCDFRDTIADVGKDDLIYCDPPYLGRYADYYNSWSEEDEKALFEALSNVPAKFILSTWSHNEYRINPNLEKYWRCFRIIKQEHFYHLGGKEENRRPMVEALVYNFPIAEPDMIAVSNAISSISQTPLFESLPV